MNSHARNKHKRPSHIISNNGDLDYTTANISFNSAMRLNALARRCPSRESFCDFLRDRNFFCCWKSFWRERNLASCLCGSNRKLRQCHFKKFYEKTIKIKFAAWFCWQIWLNRKQFQSSKCITQLMNESQGSNLDSLSLENEAGEKWKKRISGNSPFTSTGDQAKSSESSTRH